MATVMKVEGTTPRWLIACICYSTGFMDSISFNFFACIIILFYYPSNNSII